MLWGYKGVIGEAEDLKVVLKESWGKKKHALYGI
jgi:hypothetical protein